MPVQVSHEERDAREKTHAPYREWGRYCVLTRGQKVPHMRCTANTGEQGRQVPQASMDYIFMGKDDREANDNPVLLVLNAATDGVGTRHWKKPRGNGRHHGEACQGRLGGDQIVGVCQGDWRPHNPEVGEKAMTASRDSVATFHGGTVVPENPPKRGSRSNGSV